MSAWIRGLDRATRVVPFLVVSFAPLIAACTRAASPPRDVAAERPRLMSPQELQALPASAPDRRVVYGDDSSQYGELRVPAGRGPFPVVVLIHGGCFKSTYASLRDLSPMADALRPDGVATWNIEYRRVGQPGGGWPGTYLDVGRAVDHLRTLALEHALDLGRVVVVGHSAGGNLAMWAAARARLPLSSAVYAAQPLPVRGVVDLAGPVDLTANIDGYQTLCRDTVITGLLGGPPAAVPGRYAHASPIRLLPLGVPQVLVIGEHEDFVPRPLMEAYAQAAAAAGDRVRLVVIPRVGHFEIASPRVPTWQQIRLAINSLIDGQLPPRSPMDAR